VGEEGGGRRRKGGEYLGFRPHFDIRHKLDTRLVNSRRRPSFNLKEIPWYSFLLKTEWTPGHLNAYRKNRSMENFLRALPVIEPGTSRLVA